VRKVPQALIGDRGTLASVADPLDDAREKLKRARSHLANLKRQATKLGRDTSRHSVLVDYDPDEGHYVVYAKTRPEPLPNLSLILGDVIHCARGALDFTAWQLACKHLGREPTDEQAPSIQFPITHTPGKFAKAKVLPFVSKKVWREMGRHQPHPGSDPDNDHLAVLQWISNRDKHRLIVPLFADITPPLMPEYTLDPRAPRGSGVEIRHTFLMGPRQGASEDEIFYKGDPTTVKLGRLTLMPPLPNTKVYIDPQPPLNVLFGGPDGHLSMPDVEALLGHVKFVVGCFDRFF
jgi:hypothetical protein